MGLPEWPRTEFGRDQILQEAKSLEEKMGWAVEKSDLAVSQIERWENIDRIPTLEQHTFLTGDLLRRIIPLIVVQWLAGMYNDFEIFRIDPESQNDAPWYGISRRIDEQLRVAFITFNIDQKLANDVSSQDGSDGNTYYCINYQSQYIRKDDGCLAHASESPNFVNNLGTGSLDNDIETMVDVLKNWLWG